MSGRVLRVVCVLSVALALAAPGVQGSDAGDELKSPASGASFTMIPAGHYRLSSEPRPFEAPGTVVLPGAIFDGPVFPAGETDGAALAGGFGFSVLSAVRSAGTAGTLHASLAIGATQQAGDYEKMAIYSRVVTGDASIYGGARSNRDAVGVESQCRFSGNIATGRCWAFDSITTVPAGTDGYAVGEEITIANDGSDQPSINQPTSKIGLHLVSGGSLSSTAGIVFSATHGVRWHDGIVVKRSAVADYAFVVRDDALRTAEPTAAINTAGDALFHEVTATGPVRHGAVQRDVPRSGVLIAMQPDMDTEVLAPAAGIDAARLMLPAGRPGMDLRILCARRIAHLAVLAGGAPVLGLSDMACEPGRGHQYSYYPTDGWIQLF